MMCTAVGLVLYACAAAPPPIVEPGAGQTIELKTARNAVLPEQPVTGDTGVNVLLDHAHQATFHMMWSMPGALREVGFRVVGSHAALDSVLDPKGKCRIRIAVGERMPFAWWPNPRYNAVFTYQYDPKAQDYAPDEVEALKKFVSKGGGLVMSGAPVADAELNKAYPLNKLAKEFGAALTTESVVVGADRAAVLAIGPEWNIETSAGGKTVMASRPFGKGRVVLCGDPALVNWDDKAKVGEPHFRPEVQKKIKAALMSASSGTKPIGGSLRLPMENAAGVGGPIYPELEEKVEGAVAYYAKNQFKSVLDTVRVDMPKVDKNVRGWTPSPAPKDPMFLILAAGYGGGWAVNIYEPKEVGIIAPDSDGILSILAHEVAHTCYSGPPNDQGVAAGGLPGVFSEAHAGWFQRRSDFQRNGKTGHNANNLFTFDKDGTTFDLARSENAPYGQAWTKLWWLWQKLDERYGTTWYPRWLWVKNVRWAAAPSKELSWDEVVEDMSIACGEDLFPFMRKIGTTLSKDRFASASFGGKTLDLAVADIPLGPCGDPILGPIGDYKLPVGRK